MHHRFGHAKFINLMQFLLSFRYEIGKEHVDAPYGRVAT